jgi:hypothetical protein
VPNLNLLMNLLLFYVAFVLYCVLFYKLNADCVVYLVIMGELTSARAVATVDSEDPVYTPWTYYMPFSIRKNIRNSRK